MKFNVSLIVAALICSAVVAADNPDHPRMGSYQLILLKAGPNLAVGNTKEGQQTVVQHVQHLYKLNSDGPLLVAGPFADGGDIQGILLVDAPTPERAMQIEGVDPAVKAGLFMQEAMPLMLQKDSFGKWAEFGKFQRVFFGFLKSGPNRSHDAKTAEKLQEQHLAYMTQQSDAGRLVMAGPFETESDRRGIVVYQAASQAEALKFAEGDPMVKAGRLVVELHPWQVPAGSIARLKATQ